MRLPASPLYQRVIVPPTVVDELNHERTPRSVSSWVQVIPNWIRVTPPSTSPRVELSFLGPGERDAIQLALELGISKILIDEQQGKREAHSRKLTTIGTLGVLIAGHKAGFIDARPLFDQLVRSTTFHSTSALRQEFLAKLGAVE